MNKFFARTRSRSGQSIIEAIIAISVLTMGLLGMLALLTKSFTLNNVASSDTQATYLAAEGIEITKNLIDHDTFLSLAGLGGGWGTTCFALVAVNGPGKDYELDYNTAATCPTPWSGSGRPLKIDVNTHLYSYTGTQTSPFTRRIRVSRPSNDEIEVQSIVTWNIFGSAQNLILDDHFYNWRS